MGFGGSQNRFIFLCCDWRLCLLQDCFLENSSPVLVSVTASQIPDVSRWLLSPSSSLKDSAQVRVEPLVVTGWHFQWANTENSTKLLSNHRPEPLTPDRMDSWAKGAYPKSWPSISRDWTDKLHSSIFSPPFLVIWFPLWPHFPWEEPRVVFLL